MIRILWNAKVVLVSLVVLATMVIVQNLNPALWERKVASIEKLQLNTRRIMWQQLLQDLVLFMRTIPTIWITSLWMVVSKSRKWKTIWMNHRLLGTIATVMGTIAMLPHVTHYNATVSTLIPIIAEGMEQPGTTWEHYFLYWHVLHLLLFHHKKKELHAKLDFMF